MLSRGFCGFLNLTQIRRIKKKIRRTKKLPGTRKTFLWHRIRIHVLSADTPKTSLNHSLKLCMIFHPDKLGSCQCFIKQSLFTYSFFSHFPWFSFSSHIIITCIYFVWLYPMHFLSHRYCPLLFAVLKFYNTPPPTNNNSNIITSSSSSKEISTLLGFL